MSANNFKFRIKFEDSLENVDDAQLEEVEKLLEAAEQRYEASDSEAKVRERFKRAEADAQLQKRWENQPKAQIKATEFPIPTHTFKANRFSDGGTGKSAPDQRWAKLKIQ